MFYKGSIGNSAGTLWGFNEIISIWISTVVRLYSKGTLQGTYWDCKGIHTDAIECLQGF